MGKITSTEEYYRELEKAKIAEDEIIKTFALFQSIGVYLKELSEFDIASSRNLSEQILKKIGENYPNIYGVVETQIEGYITPVEETAILIRQKEIRNKFAKK